MNEFYEVETIDKQTFNSSSDDTEWNGMDVMCIYLTCVKSTYYIGISRSFS